MPRWLFAALVMFPLGLSVAAQTPVEQVMSAEQATVDAGRKGDAVGRAKLISDDYAEVSVTGQLRDKKYAVSLAGTPGMEIRDVTVQVFGDVAVVTGVQGEAPHSRASRFTRVWHKRNNQWVNVFAQHTPITSAPPASNPITPAQIAPTKWPRGQTQDERDVLKVQRGLNETFAKHDSAAYAQMTADTFVRINTEGNMISRGDFLKIVAGDPNLRRVESNNSGFRLRVHGPIAMVSYVDKTLNSPPAGIRMTRVFVKQNGLWKQLVTQSTTVVPQ